MHVQCMEWCVCAQYPCAVWSCNVKCEVRTCCAGTCVSSWPSSWAPSSWSSWVTVPWPSGPSLTQKAPRGTRWIYWSTGPSQWEKSTCNPHCARSEPTSVMSIPPVRSSGRHLPERVPGLRAGPHGVHLRVRGGLRGAPQPRRHPRHGSHQEVALGPGSAKCAARCPTAAGTGLHSQYFTMCVVRCTTNAGVCILGWPVPDTLCTFWCHFDAGATSVLGQNSYPGGVCYQQRLPCLVCISWSSWTYCYVFSQHTFNEKQTSSILKETKKQVWNKQNYF